MIGIQKLMLPLYLRFRQIMRSQILIRIMFQVYTSGTVKLL